MLFSWINEFWWVLGLVTPVFITGLILGHPLLFLLLGLIAYLGWHLLNLSRLLRWLKTGKKLEPPISRGLWGEIFNDIHRMQVRTRKRKRKLTQMLGRFQEATSVLPDATVVLGIHGEIEWCNEASHTLLGLRWPHDTNQRIANLVRHPKFIVFLSTADYSGTVEIPSPVNADILLATLIVPYGKDKRLLVARDITRIHHLEQVRRDFVANVSHELRTPLTVVNGFLENLNEDSAECPKHWVRALQLMKQQTTRMQNIVKDLLMLSRLEIDQQIHTEDDVDVADMSTLLLRDARAVSSERHDIQLEADTGLCLRGNYDELHSAFSNLIFNAVHYTSPGGKIHIRWFEDATGAHWRISDTGDGIPAHHLPRLTERFYRVDAGRSRQRGGTGLGLAIVKHILNHHAAHLQIESELGKGSVFSCDFPASAIVRPVLDEMQAD